MDGILSGLGFSSSKKKEKEQKNTSESKGTPSSTSTTDTDTQTTTTQQSPSDRSNDMRLSKNTPKPADNDFDIPSDPIVPSYTSSSTDIGAKVEPVISPNAVIGQKISFKGELTGEEDLLIQGRVEGTIDLKGNHLTIGKQGVVKANLMAKSITVEGTVEGDVIGQDRISIMSTSRVTGNLMAERVTLEDGAKFRGSIDMDTSNQAPATSPAPTTSSGKKEYTTVSSSNNKDSTSKA